MSAEPYTVLAAERAGAFGLVRGLTPAVTGFAVVAGAAAFGGGYFPTSWGWSALALFAVAAGALAFRSRVSLSGLEQAFLGTLAGLVAWTALSALWSESVPRSVQEVERSLVYLAGALALLAVAERGSVGRLLGGALAGTTAVAGYGLATRLFPKRIDSLDPITGYRLSEPLGYWNALGLLCAMGALIALGLAAQPGRPHGRAAAAAALPVLSSALFFTFSRGAWAALAFGLVAVIALERYRLRLVAALAALAPASVLAVCLASRSHALTHRDALLPAALREGQRLTATLALLSLVSAVCAVALAHAQRRVRVRRRARRALGIALILIAFSGAGLLVALHGGPAALAHKAYAGFTAKADKDRRPDLNGRVLSLSSNGRVALWGAAWRDAASHPLLGSGAGTYERFFDVHRDTPTLNVRDAHNLYLETLAELGPVGLVLLLGVLGLPLVAAMWTRRDALAVTAAGVYVAYLAHAAWDWDWEMPVVTLTGLLAGVALLSSARPAGTGGVLSGRVRAALAAALLVPMAFSAVAALGNRASAAAAAAAEAGDFSRAAALAREARRFAPWSPEPWRRIGQARLADGDLAGAAAAFRSAIARDPSDWALWLDLSIASNGAARRQALERARELNPLNPDIPTN